MNVKGQASVEALLILSFFLALTLIVFAYALQGYGTLVDMKEEAEYTTFTKKLANKLNEVWFAGKGTKLIFEGVVPNNLDDSYIIDNGFVFVFDEKQYVEVFSFDLEGELPNSSGYVKIKIENKGDKIKLEVIE